MVLNINSFKTPFWLTVSTISVIANILMGSPQPIKANLTNQYPSNCVISSQKPKFRLSCTKTYANYQGNQASFAFVDLDNNGFVINGTIVSRNKLYVNAVGVILEGNFRYAPGSGECTITRRKMLCHLYLKDHPIKIDVSY